MKTQTMRGFFSDFDHMKGILSLWRCKQHAEIALKGSAWKGGSAWVVGVTP